MHVAAGEWCDEAAGLRIIARLVESFPVEGVRLVNCRIRKSGQPRGPLINTPFPARPEEAAAFLDRIGRGTARR